jgi:hypothetical protein
MRVVGMDADLGRKRNGLQQRQIGNSNVYDRSIVLNIRSSRSRFSWANQSISRAAANHR